MIGKSLGHYRIIEKLGAGGMGVVYRAEDSNLHRHVAVKLLPDDASANNGERLARFQREAEMLASLNHPNIAAIHGFEESGGMRFIVMELVEGETLARRLRNGPLSVSDAMEVCRQIAEGLDAAHERGVIHCDLKPANVMVTADEQVKILDFGLAKALAAESAAAAATRSSTITDAITREVSLFGTAAYMSPEQLKGKPVDKRADIWAFGCILYECLTRKSPFRGKTDAETIAKTLEGTPDWDLLPPATPWRAKDLLHRCLEKNPKERLHDIGDARFGIEAPTAAPSQLVITSAKTSPLRWILLSTAALALGLVGGALLLRYFARPNSVASQQVVRARIRLGPGQWLDGMPRDFHWPTRNAVALSGNGRFLVYSAIKEDHTRQDQPRLYMRRLDKLDAKPITGTEGGINPFLSPDDRWVGFWADGKLKKVPVEGGVATELSSIPSPFGFSWGADNQIVFAPGEGYGLSRISADGGKPEVLSYRSKDEYGHRLPHTLPGGRCILFTVVRHGTDWQPGVALLEVSTRKHRIFIDDAADAQYIATGHLAFIRHGTLMLAPFDLGKLEITGPPFPLTESVMQALNTGSSSGDSAAGQFSISTSGSLIFVPGGTLPDRENSLVWVDPRGNCEPLTPLKAPFHAPRLSPEGQRIAYYTLGPQRQIYIYDLRRGTNMKLTSEGAAVFPTWTTDGRSILFGWLTAGVRNLYHQAADGGSPMERLMPSEFNQCAGSWTPGGDNLAFVEFHPSTSWWDIHNFHLPDQKITPFLNSRFHEVFPEFSPDGRLLAYVSNESGREEVYVRSFPGPGQKWPISSEGGTEPLWSRDGSLLYYRRGSAPDQVWAVDVRTKPAFSPGRPRLLFERPGYSGDYPIRGWDISLDNKRFLMVKTEERKPQPVTEMILVHNWFEEIKRMSPANGRR